MTHQPDQFDELVRCLDELTEPKFVELVAEHLEARDDFDHIEIGPRGPDRGADIIADHRMSTDSVPRRTVFQLKHYTARAPNSNAVADLLKGMALKEAQEGILVSTRPPTDDAREHIRAMRKQNQFIAYDPWCGRNLARTLLRTPRVVSKFFPDLGIPFLHEKEIEVACPSFEVVPKLSDISVASNADSFYSGHPPSWGELRAQFDIPRDVYAEGSELRSKLASLLTRPAITVVSVTGVAGSGKTTLLKRIALDTAENGIPALKLREDWLETPVSLARQVSDASRLSNSPLLVLVDNASDLVFERNIFDRTIRELRSSVSDKSIVVICSDETHRWAAASRRVPSLSLSHKATVHHLLASECQRLVDSILMLEKASKLTTITDMSREGRLHLCETPAERQLLVAMYQMRHGEQFKVIMRAEYERVPLSESRMAYGLVSQLQSLSLAAPKRAILEAVGVRTAEQIAEFAATTNGLLVEDALGYRARHLVIARTVAQHAYPNPESRQAAIAAVLKVLDPDEQGEHELFLQVFVKPNMYRRVAGILGRKIDLLRSFYADSRTVIQDRWPPSYVKYVATADGMTQRLLGSPDKARGCFREAVLADPTYEFAVRQAAWLEHSEGEWEEAAQLARRAAELAPNNVSTLLQCGKILTLNTVANFRLAKKYIHRAFELDPSRPGCSEMWESYCGAENVASVVSSLAEDQVIPEYVQREVRPGLAFLRALHGPTDRRVRERLKGELQYMEEQVRGEMGDLYDAITGINVGKNPVIRALISCNVGRLLYLEWYHRGEPHAPDDIEKAFTASLVLNPKDPFSHCWYGTFLKEVKNDYSGARREYEEARRIGDGARNPRLKEHPLFLNNLALLTMDEVQKGVASPVALRNVHELLAVACRRVHDLKSDFHWPEQSFDLCKALMREYTVVGNS